MDNSIKTSNKFPIPKSMKAWVLGNPNELKLIEKDIILPKKSEVLVKIDAVAICATDLDVISKGPPAMIEGGDPFNKNFTPGHEYMGTIVALGPSVDEFEIGNRVTVEIHAGCGQCKRCRMGMYTSCHNYGLNYGNKDKGHRANGFTTDGGFKQFAINHINTLIKVPDDMTDEEATLVVTAGTTMYGLTELGGLVAGESLVVIGPGPIGLLGVAVAKALGADPVILIGTRNDRLEIGKKLGADFVLNVKEENDIVNSVKSLVGYLGVDYVVECAGTEKALDDANLEKIIKNLYQTVGFKKQEEFKSYLNSQNLKFSLVKRKLAIEMLWNNLIFEKFNNRVVIDESEIRSNLDKEIKNLKFSRNIFLSEILIRNSKDLKLDIVYSEILKSIKDVGFAATANIFSISNTSKVGGKVGWIKETSLSKQIQENIINLKKGQISKPIKINENFLILAIDDVKINKKTIDKNRILSSRISYYKNQQLERFSLAYFGKIKQSIQINEL